MSEKLLLQDGIGFVELLEVFGSDLTVVNAARVSFHKESEFELIFDENDSNKIIGSELSTRDKELVEYLAKHNHVAPFFHPQLRFRIRMPIFIAREWYRHTVGFARNEVSRRYVTEAPEFFIPSVLRKRDKNIKQGSSSEVVENNEQLILQMHGWAEKALNYYNELLACGVCPEQARTVLPQSMYTEFIETASLGGYARLAKLRLEGSAQKEIREYAQFVSSLVEKHFPASWRALMK